LLYFTASAVNGRVRRNSEKSDPKGRTAEEKRTPNKAKINPETLSPCSALRSCRLRDGNTGLNTENKAERHETRPHLCIFSHFRRIISVITININHSGQSRHVLNRFCRYFAVKKFLRYNYYRRMRKNNHYCRTMITLLKNIGTLFALNVTILNPENSLITLLF